MCCPALRTSSMRSHDESGKTSVEHADGSLPMSVIRPRPPQTNGSGRLIPWFDLRHDFWHAIGGLALPYMALTHAVRDEQ
jgi:hypothetical protein